MRKELIGSFWQKFGTLIESGIPLLRSLSAIEKEITDSEFKVVLQDIKAMITSGKNMLEAISEHPEYFPPSVQEMVKAGELTGTLDKYSLKIAEGLKDGTFKIGQTQTTEKISAIEVDKLPEVKVTNLIIMQAVKDRASDIHIEWLKDKMRVRYRIDGVLKEIASPPPKELQEALISRIKIMAGLNVAEKKLPQDGRMQLNIEGRELDLRVSVVPYITGESITIRILDSRSVMLLPLEKQGFSEHNLKMLRNWSKKRFGIIIVTGPRGCGKTTTLYALIQKLNQEGVKITTVEDPLEYQFDGINQMRVNPRIGLTFARSIRSQLRQDPDIMMVGELRDLETFEIIIQASLTGHLVFTALHTNDAPGAVRRLLDMGVKPFLLNNTLTGIVSQRLVRIICKECKEEYKPEDWVIDSLKTDKDMKFFRGKGCDKCNKTGYRGRTAIHELLEIDDNMKSLIAQDAGLEKLRKQAKKSGMITLREDGIEKVKQGITTIEEVLRVVPGS